MSDTPPTLRKEAPGPSWHPAPSNCKSGLNNRAANRSEHKRQKEIRWAGRVAPLVAIGPIAARASGASASATGTTAAGAAAIRAAPIYTAPICTATICTATLGIIVRSTGMIGVFAIGRAVRTVAGGLIVIGRTFGAVTTAGGPFAASAIAGRTCETAPGSTAAETAPREAAPFKTFSSAAGTAIFRVARITIAETAHS